MTRALLFVYVGLEPLIFGKCHVMDSTAIARMDRLSRNLTVAHVGGRACQVVCLLCCGSMVTVLVLECCFKVLGVSAAGSYAGLPRCMLQVWYASGLVIMP